MSKIGVMVCGHGSRDSNAVTEFESVARGIRERLPHYEVESGFLEFRSFQVPTPLTNRRVCTLGGLPHLVDLVGSFGTWRPGPSRRASSSSSS